jgi:hypothetical protein
MANFKLASALCVWPLEFVGALDDAEIVRVDERLFRRDRGCPSQKQYTGSLRSCGLALHAIFVMQACAY